MTLLSGYKAASGDKPPIAVLAALRHPKQAQCRVSQPGRDFAHIRSCQPRGLCAPLATSAVRGFPTRSIQTIDAGLTISSCGSNFKLVPKARETRHNFSARLRRSSARSRSSADAILRLGRTTICVKL